MTTQRERFEEARGFYLDKNENGEYRITSTKIAWEAWQEAERQTIERCVKLCEEVHKGLAAKCDTFLNEGDSTTAASHNAAAIAVREFGEALQSGVLDD